LTLPEQLPILRVREPKSPRIAGRRSDIYRLRRIRYEPLHLPGAVMSSATSVNDANFDTEVLKSSTPVLVDFWAPWCGPCRAVAPTVDALSQEFAGKLKVVKLNTDESGEVAMKYAVTSIPTLMVFKNGEMVERVLGNRPKADLAAMVSRHL